MSDANVAPFDVADLLTDSETIKGFLQDASDSQDPALIAAALGAVARAVGITKLSRKTGISRTALYDSFGKNGNPTLANTLALSNALGVAVRFDVTGAGA